VVRIFQQKLLLLQKRDAPSPSGNDPPLCVRGAHRTKGSSSGPAIGQNAEG
jgi:hypothetical protein